MACKLFTQNYILINEFIKVFKEFALLSQFNFLINFLYSTVKQFLTFLDFFLNWNFIRYILFSISFIRFDSSVIFYLYRFLLIIASAVMKFLVIISTKSTFSWKQFEPLAVLFCVDYFYQVEFSQGSTLQCSMLPTKMGSFSLLFHP